VADSGGSCKEEFGSACKGLPTDDKRAGKLYCVLHSPRVNKDLAAFEGAIEKKLRDKDFDFAGVYFPENLNFYKATVEGPAVFRKATFERGAHCLDATFEGRADFTGATFKGREATFQASTFMKKGGVARFHGTTFMKEAIFRKTTFEGEAIFYDATFESEAEFTMATFMNKADFSWATFKEKAIFTESRFEEEGKFWSLQTTSGTVLSLRAAEIERPERISFHSTSLRPSAFVDVNPQEFDFTDVEWFRWPKGDELKQEDEQLKQEDELKQGDKLKLEDEIKAVEAQGRPLPYPRPTAMRKLQRACRRLMNNAEENRDYPTANKFHYWSMELLRKESWRRLGLIGTLYWALSGYGERPRRAFLVLVGMWALFAFLYGMVAGAIEHVEQAALYSLATMVRLTNIPAMAEVTTLLQPSEPGLFQVLVTAEGILGPLQIALLALAIRRQVMR
jgi:uncharacterized protein YjbI with pentapeptide repeats